MLGGIARRGASFPGVVGVLSAVLLGVLLVVSVKFFFLAAFVVAVGSTIWKRLDLLPHVTIIATFAAVPSFVPRSLDFGPFTILLFEPFLLLTALWLIYKDGGNFRLALSFRGAHALVAFTGLVLLSSVIGVYRANSFDFILREARPLLTFALTAFVSARLIGSAESYKYLRTLGFVLIFSAGVTLGASIFGYGLEGRSEAAQLYSTSGGNLGGSGDATRYLTPASTVATVFVAGFLYVYLSRGRLRLLETAMFFSAVVVAFFSFSRYHLFAIVVALVVSLVTLVLRQGVGGVGTWFARIGIAVLAVTLLTLVVSLSSGPGDYVNTQLSSFSSRVIAGLDPTTQEQDTSAQDRVAEDSYLSDGISRYPIVGSGLGYAYKPALGRVGEFAATDGRYYAHNFYLWLWLKLGPLGLLCFGVLLYCCIRTAWGAEEKRRVAMVSVLVVTAVMSVSPLPIATPNCVLAGLVVGAVLGCSFSDKRLSINDPSSDQPSQLSTPLSPSGAYRIG